MNKNLFVLHLFILFCFHQVLSQEVSQKDFQIVPYIGINLPQGNLKDFSKNGAVFGVSIDKYLNSNLALGIDYNFQSNDFSNSFDFSSISAPYSILNSTTGKWNASIITFGPTYRLGTSKFNAEIFAKLGLLYLKTPQAESVFQYSDGTKTIFNLPAQERSGFGVTSGIRLNYRISKNLSLFLNPQYVYGSAKVEYCDCGLDNLENPELIIDQDPIKETISPSYFNVNAGLTFTIGGNNKGEIENNSSTNRNLPGCLVNLHAVIECTTGGPLVVLNSDWWGQDPNSTLSVTGYDGVILVYDTTSITLNNQALGVSTDSRNHNFNAFGYEGRTLTAKIVIKDQNGVVKCIQESLPIEIPNCQYAISCGWDYWMECDSSTNSIKINVPIVWSNIPTGSNLNFYIVSAINGNSIPFTSNPANLPFSISGTGNTNYELFINGHYGEPISFKYEITGPDGTIICSQGADTSFPTCEFTSCEPVLISASCVNETPTIDFSVPWTNYPLYANYSVYVDLYDSNQTLITSSTIPPYPLNGVNGTANFSVSLPSHYAGTTINIITRICTHGGVKDCCAAKLTIEIPKCCEICSDLNVIDNTNPNQSNGQVFNIKGNINPVSNSSPIKKIIAQLESISYSNRVTPGVAAPNFELNRGWFATGSGSSLSVISGSLTGSRSNLLIADINATTATNMTFILNIDNYFQKQVMSYKVKLTIFKQDGTYCEKTLTYQR